MSKDVQGHKTRKVRDMKSGTAVVIFALATPFVFSQLTIENPRQRDVPEAQARILLQLSFQTVAKQLRPAQKTNVEFPMLLVIGQEDERFGLDEKTGVPTLFLQQWDPVKFTTAAVKFAIRNSVRSERQEQMILEIVRRSKAVAPVSAAQLRGSAGIAPPALPPFVNNCPKGISDASVRELLCPMVPGNRSATAK
jgi:hypothetical protein